MIEFNLFAASHGSTSGVAIYCAWQYIDIFHNKEFLFTGFHGCYVRVPLYQGLTFTLCGPESEISP